jgi:threonyl-tRNA synthetase
MMVTFFAPKTRFCRKCVNYTALLQKVYTDFGFKNIIYKIATRPEQRIGSDEVWDKAEAGFDGKFARFWMRI